MVLLSVCSSASPHTTSLQFDRSARRTSRLCALAGVGLLGFAGCANPPKSQAAGTPPAESAPVVVPAADASRGQAGALSNQAPAVTATAPCVAETGADVQDAARVMMNTAGSAALGMPDAQATMKSAADSGAPAMPDAQVTQTAIAVAGALEVEVSGGVRHAVATGQLVFLEDTTGQGHMTRPQGAVTNMFIAVPDSFDVVAWAQSPF